MAGFKYLCTIGVLMMVVIPTSGQSIVNYESYFDNYLVRNIDREDGLYRDEVYDTYQDSLGFIWIANYAFLFRYDGITLKQYQYDIDRMGVFTEFKEDNSGNVWIPGSGQGLRRINSDKSSTTYDDSNGITGTSLRNVAFTKGDSVIIGDFLNGIFIMHEDTVLKNIKVESGLAGNRVYKIITDSKNRTWVGTDKGLSILYKNEIINFDSKNGLGENSVLSIFEMQNGEVWVGTDGGGITIFSDYKPKEILDLSDGINDMSTEFITERISDKSIWLGHTGGGIDKITEDKIENFSTEKGLLSDYVSSIKFGETGNIYVGTEFGLSILIPKKIKFKPVLDEDFSNAAINGVAEDFNKNLWVATAGDGIYINQNSKWKQLPSTKNIGALTILPITPEKTIIGTAGDGIYLIENDEVIKRINSENGLLGDEVTCLAQDIYDNVWVGTFYGISIFDTNLQKLQSFTEESGLPGQECLQMISDKKGNVWVGTLSDGILKFKEDRFVTQIDTSDGLVNNRIFGLYENIKGEIVATTIDFGFHFIENEKVTAIPGIPDTFVGINQDKFGDYWFTSNGYIVKLEEKDLELYFGGEITRPLYKKYTTEDGLPQTRFSYGNSSVSEISSTGEIFFAAKKGIIAVDPEEAVLNAEYFFPYIDYLKINGESVPVDKTSDLRFDASATKFEISYSALNLNAPEKTEFFIQLEGVDDDWVSMKDRKIVYYDFLPEGDYTFRVAALAQDGEWSPNRASLSFSILPPFYKTWWFMSLGLLGFIAVGAGGVQIRSNIKLRALNRELETQQKIQKERERISRELHDNVGSQITNLITGIEVSNLHVKKNQQDEALSLLENLDSDARGAMTDLRETIWLLDKEMVEFEAFIEHLNGYLNRQKRYLNGLEIKLNSTIDNGCVLEPGQSMNLTRIIQEALNNCRKYAEANEFIISFRLENQKLYVNLVDDGKGMDLDEEIDKGNGIKNMSHRAEEMDAKFQIKSDRVSGVEIEMSFDVKIP